jgi:hypothetical protein
MHTEVADCSVGGTDMFAKLFMGQAAQSWMSREPWEKANVPAGHDRGVVVFDPSQKKPGGHNPPHWEEF